LDRPCSACFPAHLAVVWVASIAECSEHSALYRELLRTVSTQPSRVHMLDGWIKMDEWMDGWMARWMDGRTNGWIDGWMDGRMNGRIDGWMDGWMDGRTDRQMDGWMDGRKSERMNT